MDHTCFLLGLKESGLISLDSYSASLPYYEQFLTIQDKVLFFDVSVQEAINREGKHKPFVGRVFNATFLENLRAAYLNGVNHFKKAINITQFDGNSNLSSNLEIILKLSMELKGGE